MAARRKWRVVPQGGSHAERNFPSQTKAYEYVREIRDEPGDTTIIHVLVDEGRGWESYENQMKGRDF